MNKKALSLALGVRRRASKVPLEIRKKYAEPVEGSISDASERLANIIKNITQSKSNDKQS